MTWQRIDENTYIDDTLVTCAEYQLFIDEMREQGKYYQPDHWTSYQFPEGQAKKPILGVRYSDACDFCAWLTKRWMNNWTYRLPKQVEIHQFELRGDKNEYWVSPPPKSTVILLPSDVAGIIANDLERLSALQSAFERRQHIPKTTIEIFSQNPTPPLQSSGIFDVEYRILINRSMDIHFQKVIRDEQLLKNCERMSSYFGLNLDSLISITSSELIKKNPKDYLDEIFKVPSDYMLTMIDIAELVVDIVNTMPPLFSNYPGLSSQKVIVAEVQNCHGIFINRLQWRADYFFEIGDPLRTLMWYFRIVHLTLLRTMFTSVIFTNKEIKAQISSLASKFILATCSLENNINGITAPKWSIRIVKEKS